MKTLIPFVVIAIVLMLIAVVVKAKLGGRGKQAPVRYKQCPIMTENEVEFFGRLSRALPGFHVFPQVAMAALIEPVESRKNNLPAYNAVSQKRVDYAIFDKAMELITIVELDDRTHSTQADLKRDAMPKSAGVSTIRWQSKAKPSEPEIFLAIQGLIGCAVAGKIS